MELYMGFISVYTKQSLQSCIQLAMEIKLSSKKESFLLASYERQTQYQGTSEKETLGITKLQLCALSSGCRGVSSSYLHGLPFCFDLLESAGACTSNSSKHVRLNSFVQNSNQHAILHGSNCLGHLVCL